MLNFLWNKRGRLVEVSGIFTIDELRKGEFLSLKDREVSNAVLFSNNEKEYTPRFIHFVLICLSVGFCFSIICIPFHLSFAKEYAINKKKNMINTFLITQGTLIMFVAFLFAVFYLTVSLLAF